MLAKPFLGSRRKSARCLLRIEAAILHTWWLAQHNKPAGQASNMISIERGGGFFWRSWGPTASRPIPDRRPALQLHFHGAACVAVPYGNTKLETSSEPTHTEADTSTRRVCHAKNNIHMQKSKRLKSRQTACRRPVRGICCKKYSG